MPGFFSNTLAVLRREIHRVARQPMYWLLTVILPIVAFAFFAVLLYKGVARDIPIAVVDQDNSTLSRKVTQMIDATPTAWVAYGVQGMEEAERLMLQGKVMGIVLIPDFFEKNILNNSQTHLESYLTGTNITVNGLLAKDLQTTVTTFTAGIQLQLLMKQGLTEKQAMAQLMPVRFDKHVLFNPHINYGYYLSPSFMPMMLLIFTIMATIFVIGTELKNGTAREWYDTAGGSVFAAYAGKILPITVIMFLMSELMLLVIFKVVGVPLNGSLTVITISNLLFILSYQSLGAMIVTVLSNLRLSLSIGGGYSVLAFTFSGLTFPIMAMSKPMQWFCCIFPFTFYTDIMVDQALRGAPAIYSLPDMGIIALFIILPLLCLPRLRTICTNKKYWGEIIAMSRFTKQITSYWQQFRTVVRNEYGSIFTDAGVILVLVLALLIYSTLYSLAYGTQVLRNVPIGVIDMSNTSTSRQLINTFNAGPNVYVAYEPGDMDEAKHLFYDREIYGVVYIPSDYEEKLLGGQQAVVSLYVDARGVPGARVGHRHHRSYGGIPAVDRKRSQHPAGYGHDATRDLPKPQFVQSLSGIRIVRDAGYHHGHHPTDDADRYRYDRRHLERIRTLQETHSSGTPENVHAARRGRQSVRLCVDLRRHPVLYFGTALQIVSFPDQRSHGGHHRLSHPVSAVLYFPGHRRLDAVPATRTVDHAVTLVFDPGSDAQRSFRTPRSDARMALPVRPDSAEQQRGRRVHPAPKYGGFVQRRVARGTYPVDSHDSLRRIRCCRHTPSPQEGRR